MAAKVLDPRLIDYTPDDGDSYLFFMECMGNSFGEAPGSWGFQYLRMGFGYCPKTMQRSVSIGLPKDADLDIARQEAERSSNISVRSTAGGRYGSESIPTATTASTISPRSRAPANG